MNYDLANAANSALNNQAAYLGISQANAKRADTALESVVNRLSSICSRVHANAARVGSAADILLGYEGEQAAGNVGAPMPVPTSVQDYLIDIEAALNKLEYKLGRFTQ